MKICVLYERVIMLTKVRAKFKLIVLVIFCYVLKIVENRDVDIPDFFIYIFLY